MEIIVSLKFLSPEEGGRKRKFILTNIYRPHFVSSIDLFDIETNVITYQEDDHYMGVDFPFSYRIVEPNVAYEETVRLVYYPEVDYTSLITGSYFTVREGGRVVAFGEVVLGIEAAQEFETEH